jgi:phosphate transport system substrate-binding protein
MNRRIFAGLVLITAAASCTRHSEQLSEGAGEKDTVSIKGSDTMVILSQRWAEAYMQAHPKITLQVSGGGSGTGIAALINGSTDICDASRPMSAKEKADLQAKRGKEAIETKVALDALAVYVNAKNPVHELSLPALSKIYLGQTTSWKDLGGPDHAIILYGRENNSGTYGYFKEHVLGGKDFAAATQTLAGTSAVANAVKGDEFGIGYGGIAYSEGVHALAIKRDDTSAAVLPGLETAQDGSYPISRFLYFYTAGDPSPAMKGFIDWVTGPAGQATISEVGYYPLPKKS